MAAVRRQARGAHSHATCHSNPSNRPERAHVDRIGTKPMTSHQREQSVTTLAALITAWQDSQTMARNSRARTPRRRFPFPARRATLTTPHDNPPGRDTLRRLR
jgi:hypothetical protein